MLARNGVLSEVGIGRARNCYFVYCHPNLQHHHHHPHHYIHIPHYSHHHHDPYPRYHQQHQQHLLINLNSPPDFMVPCLQKTKF